MKYFSKISTIALALMAGAIIGGAINSAAGDNAATEVYAACMTAHNEVSGTSEQHCGDLQDKYNIKFLCNHDGSKCWTEIK